MTLAVIDTVYTKSETESPVHNIQHSNNLYDSYVYFSK